MTRQNYSVKLNDEIVGTVTRPAGPCDDWTARLAPIGPKCYRRVVGTFSTATRAMTALLAAYEAETTNAGRFDPAVTLTDENGELPD